MDAPDMSIADAADYLGVTERTVRKGDFRFNRTVLRTFETIVINPEPLMQQLGDPVLELLDPQRLVTKLGAMRLPLGQQHRLQCLDVVGQRFIG